LNSVLFVCLSKKAWNTRNKKGRKGCGRHFLVSLNQMQSEVNASGRCVALKRFAQAVRSQRQKSKKQMRIGPDGSYANSATKHDFAQVFAEKYMHLRTPNAAQEPILEGGARHKNCPYGNKQLG
jgi:hypothetical protein